MTPDGVIAQLRFIAGGTGGATLHSPRGMTIVGDTLWAVDPDAVREGLHRVGVPGQTKWKGRLVVWGLDVDDGSER